MTWNTHNISVAVALAAATLLGGCVKNAATGKSHFMTMSRADEARIGEEAAPGFTDEYGGAVPDAELRAYVSRVGSSMTPFTEDYFPDVAWEFTFVDSDVVNAFALPGGKVFITRGLAERLDNEAQLAGVLGHEIGHVTAQHGNRRISSQNLFNIGVATAAIAVGASGDDDIARYGEIAVPAVAVGGNLVFLKYGRNDELEADYLGMRYMGRAGYKPSGQRGVMEVLADLSPGGDPGLAQLFATHPYPEDRIARIDELLATEYAALEADPNLHTYADRFRREFLDPLESLPPARHGMSAPTDGDQAMTPAGWCTHCAGPRRVTAPAVE